jgi:hypothetical protein
VIVRQLLAALGLGLLASLLAHAGLYGSDHALGGGYHDGFDALALAGMLGLGFATLNLAWAGRECCCLGTVLAARLSRLIPNPLALFAATAGSFACGEFVEGSHARASTWLVVLVLAAAATLVRILAGFFVQAIAAITIAIITRTFAPRLPRAIRVFGRAPALAAVPYLGRRFARPPPARA